jgi:hypothetical protein
MHKNKLKLLFPFYNLYLSGQGDFPVGGEEELGHLLGFDGQKHQQQGELGRPIRIGLSDRSGTVISNPRERHRILPQKPEFCDPAPKRGNPLRQCTVSISIRFYCYNSLCKNLLRSKFSIFFYYKL